MEIAAEIRVKLGVGGAYKRQDHQPIIRLKTLGDEPPHIASQGHRYGGYDEKSNGDLGQLWASRLGVTGEIHHEA